MVPGSPGTPLWLLRYSQAPRGLSAEEKRVKLLEIFHESKDFYQLKELEKLGPKLKVSMQIDSDKDPLRED